MNKVDLKSCKDIGKLIREFRKEQDITQGQLAGLANTGTRFIGDLENGKSTCQLGKLLRVLSALGVEMIVKSPYDKE